MPCTPKNAIANPFVFLVVVLAIEIGRQAGIKPPARAVVGTTVSRGIPVIVLVWGCKELLVMVVVPAVVESISCCAAVAVDAETVLEVLIGHVEVIVFGIFSDPIEIFQINSQLHFLAPCQEVNFVIA